MEGYFSRKINEGTIKAKHVCSFDQSIVLTRLVQRGDKVIDSIVTSSAVVNDKDAKVEDKKVIIKKELESRLAAVRINGQCILLDDLGDNFDDDEIVEVMTFINGGDMSKYGGDKPTEQDAKEDEQKNA